MANLINNQGVPNLYTDAHVNQNYTVFDLRLQFLWDEGNIQLAVAEPANEGDRGNQPSCEIVRAHAPCGQLVITFRAERNFDWPLLPSPQPQNANLVLDHVETNVATPILLTAGTAQAFAVTGEYRYFMVKPVWGPSSGLFAGWNPIDQTPFFYLSANQFRPLV